MKNENEKQQKVINARICFPVFKIDVEGNIIGEEEVNEKDSECKE